MYNLTRNRIISAIIPTKNRHKDLVECLNSLLNQSIEPTEIIIIDASDHYHTYNQLKEITRLVHIRIDKSGLPSQKNIGLDIISPGSSFILFLDDDVILDEKFIENIIDILSQSEDIIGVGGIIENYQVSWLEKLVLRLFLMRPKLPGSMAASGYVAVPTLEEINKPIESKFLPGGLSCYRLSAIKGMKFDTFYEQITGHAYCEDIDFSYRASLRGKLIITPHAKAYHKESPANRPGEYDYGIAQVVNRAYLVKKIWGNSPFHWMCFYWAIFGQTILNLLLGIKKRNISKAKGNLAGLRRIKAHLTNVSQPIKK